MYLQGGHYDLAANLAEEMADFKSASLYHLKAGDLKAAGENELQMENHDKAAYLFRRAGMNYRAAEIFEAMDRPGAAAEEFEKAGFVEKAAHLFVRAEKHLKAASLFKALIAASGKDESDPFRGEEERSRVLRYHRFCGELFLRAEQPERAANHFEEALCLEQAAEAWKAAGKVEKAADILLRLQKPEDAYIVLRSAGKDMSSLSPAVQAALLTRDGKHHEAAAVLEQAGSYFPAAEALARAGEDARAATLFEREGDLEQASIHYIKADRFADAARVLEASREFTHAADLYRKAGCLEEAARAYMKADNAVAAARIHYDRKDFDAVIRALQMVRSDHQDHRKASFLLGRVFAEQELYTLAIDKFLAAIGNREVEEDTVHIFYSLALAHQENQRVREAMQIFQKILSFDFSYKDVRERSRALETRPEFRPGRAGEEVRQAPKGERPGRDRYRIENSLGTGQVGEIFRAIDTALGRVVAIRQLPESPQTLGRAKRFLQEAAAATRLSHPNIVQTIDTVCDDEGKFIVTALAEGTSLRLLLDQKVRFEVNRIVEIGRQVLEALAHAHEQGILHRNLRPENIFVTEADRVGVTDFGLAVRLSDLSSVDLSDGRQIQYTPPEALLRGRVDQRSDLYSFGILLYEMAFGHPPFNGSTVGYQQVHEPVPIPGSGQRILPDFLKRVILRCLEKKKGERYPDARSILEDLQLKEVVPGMVVGSRFEVLAEVGRGGMGTIFRARDTELDETVALKFLSGEINAQAVARMVQEIKTSRSILHPNVVRVFTMEKWREHRFIVMEYIDGVCLDKWLERIPTPTLHDRLRVAVQISLALDAAHGNGILHRDIKPQNILITPSGEAKVLDFGIARPEASGHTLTTSGTILGSPLYISPEQIQGKQCDRRSDIYSLGCVLYLLFTGREAFAGEGMREVLMNHVHGRPRPPREIEPAIPIPVSDAILRAIESEPGRRFFSASELAKTMSGVLEESVA